MADDSTGRQGAGVTFDPARKEGHWPTFIHGENGLGDIDIPETIDLPLDPRPAHRFIIETVKANPGEVTLIAVGRMTNLALALSEEPDFAALVKEVIVMGGAFDMNGNVSPAAEANIHGDPEAADLVFTAPWRVIVVGLDVTMKTVMTSAFMADMAKAGGKPVQLLSDLSQFYIDFYKTRTGDGMVVHDSCACVYLVAPELLKPAAARYASSAAGLPTARRSRSRMAAPFRPVTGMGIRASSSAQISSRSACFRSSAPQL